MPDSAQQIMKQVLCILKNVKVYLGDIGIFYKPWEEDRILLENVLSSLEANGFRGKPLKSELAIQVTNWLDIDLHQLASSHEKNVFSLFLNKNYHATPRKCMISLVQ